MCGEFDHAFELLLKNLQLDQWIEHLRVEGLQKWPMATSFGAYLVFFMMAA